MPVTINSTPDHRSIGQAMWNGAKLRCPRCGKGHLFRAYLKVADECDVCGEELFHHRADDMPPYIAIVIVGHIIVGLDAKDGKVATDGWSKLTGHEVVDLAKNYEDYGVEASIYTDIGRDGMLQGINIDATVKLAQSVSIPVIASGGLSNLKDIDHLCAVEEHGVEGVICGRAIYSGDLNFKEAQALADKLGAA